MNTLSPMRVLTDEQRDLILYAIAHDIPIVIDGDKQFTGKSTLCYFLRDLGVNVYEAYELEYEYRKMNRDKGECNSFITILLNHPR